MLVEDQKVGADESVLSQMRSLQLLIILAIKMTTTW